MGTHENFIVRSPISDQALSLVFTIDYISKLSNMRINVIFLAHQKATTWRSMKFFQKGIFSTSKQMGFFGSKARSFGHYYCLDNLSLAYIRIPKCACTTIERWMASHHANYVLNPNYTTHSRSANEHYFDNIATDVDPKEGYFRFTFVRHPEDRFLSFFNEKLAGKKKEEPLLKRLEQFGLYHGMSKLECLELLADQPETYNFNPHFAPQYHFLLRGDELRVDFIGRLESFKRDSKILQQVSRSDKEFPIANKGATTKSNLTKRERRILNHIYEKDFCLLGYATR